ncbi:MAG TPA: TonB-dependent receptor [Gemmatimonadales bacterium]|nr:TonB-dependent receptor [Gemmatimonadales bacterium]
MRALLRCPMHAVALASMILCRTGVAQAPDQLTGTVRAQGGAPLANVRVVLHPAGQGTETDARGRFVLNVFPGADGRLTFAAVGYAPDSIALPAGARRRQVAITLAPLQVLDALSVVAPRRRPLLNTEDATTGGAVEREELEALPTDARDPLTLLFNVPGVAQSSGFFGDAPPLSLNASNSLYTQYTLDGLDNNEGFLGGPRVEFPLAGLAREEALVNTYSTVYGRSSSGIISLESLTGRDSTDGELFGYYRPGRPIDAANKVPFGANPDDVESLQDGFRRFQLGAHIRGPLARGRTFAAGAAEYANETESRIPSTARAAFAGVERREKLRLFGRVDHGWSPTQTTTLRLAFSSTRRAGEGSGVVAPEADITTARIGSLTALTHRSALRSGLASNIASVQLGTFRWNFPPTASDFTRPNVVIQSGADSSVQAVVGSSNFVFDETETQLQFRDVIEAALGGGHSLRAGGDVTTAWFELTGANTNPNGSYVVFNDGNITPAAGRFYSLEDIPADVRVRSYTIDARIARVDRTQTNYGAFVEDRWRVSPSLTVQAGVRWDYDDLTSRGESRADLDNVQPRLSFNWYATPRSVLRGGAGYYTGKLPYAVFSDAFQFGPDGNATVTFDNTTAPGAPAFGQGLTQAELQQQADLLPPREVRRTFALGLEQPFSRQVTLGYQRQLGDDWAVSLDAVFVDTRNLPRSFDLNAIARPLTSADTVSRTTDFGDAFRPVAPATNSYRRLTTTQTAGRSRYWGLYTGVRHRLSGAWTLDANWVWSRARNDTEDINFNAAQANDYAAEYADAANDRRHKVTVRSVYTFARRVRLSIIGDFQTGQPVNRLAGRINPDGTATTFDLDGSGSIFGEGFIGSNDRFPGVPRNGERLPSFFNLSGGITYLLASRLGDFELRADVFNVLNGTEWGGFANGNSAGGGRTQFGRPGDPIVLRSPGPPRQVQFSARYVF